jgi:hypothetical protein
MDPRHEAPSAADLAAEVNGLTAGLGIITTTFAPFALPGLLLVLPLVLPVIPLLLVAGVGYLLVRAPLLPLRFARKVWRRRSERRSLGDLAVRGRLLHVRPPV